MSATNRPSGCLILSVMRLLFLSFALVVVAHGLAIAQTCVVDGTTITLNTPESCSGVAIGVTAPAELDLNSAVTLSASNSVTAGLSAQGTLSVSNGGVINDADGVVGSVSGVSGIATISGSGSQWNNSNDLSVGLSGQGTLTINAGAQVSDLSGFVGADAGAVGAVLVSGTGSMWSTSGTLDIGVAGQGTVTLGQGGSVTAKTINLGAQGVITGATGSETFTVGSGTAVEGGGTISNLEVVNNGSMLASGPAPLTIRPNAGGFTNNGQLGVGSFSGGPPGTLVLDLSSPALSGGTGFESNATMGVGDGSVLEISDTHPGTVVKVNTNAFVFLGQSSGATLKLDGASSKFDFNCNLHCSTGNDNIFMQGNSSIAGVTGTETLINDTGSTIIGSGLISNLTLTNIGSIQASGGTLKTSPLTNLASGTLTGGDYEALSGTLQLPGDITTLNGATVSLNGAGSEITDPQGHNALASLTTIENAPKVPGAPVGVYYYDLLVGSGVQLTTSGNLTLQNTGILGAYGGTLNVTGNLTSDGTSIVTTSNAGTLFVTGSFNNAGTAEVGGAYNDPGNSTLSVAGAFTNDPGSTLYFFPSDSKINSVSKGNKVIAASFSNAGSVSIASETLLTVNAGGSYTQTEGSTLVNGTLNSPSVSVMGGTLMVTGGGLVAAGTLQSPGTITIGTNGTVDAKGGTLQGTVINNGTLDPLGTATINGDYTQGVNGTLILDVAGTGAGDFGQLAVSGNATFDGTIDLDFIDGFAPSKGDSFDFINVGGSADFSGATIELGGLLPGFNYSDSFQNGQFVLTALNDASPTPEPGTLLLFGTALLGLLALNHRIGSHRAR